MGFYSPTTGQVCRGRGYAPRGQTPVVYATGKYEKVSMIAAITNQGNIQWMLTEGSINTEQFQQFLKQLIKYKRKKVLLIAKPHHSKQVTEWVAAHKDKIALFYLPAYSPDLNPDEHTNADVKQGVGSKAPVKTKATLREVIEEHMQMLKKTPQRIVQYFKDHAISYAALC
jgi:transposase